MKKRGGFSLVELAVVAGLMAVLMTVLYEASFVGTQASTKGIARLDTVMRANQFCEQLKYVLRTAKIVRALYPRPGEGQWIIDYVEELDEKTLAHKDARAIVTLKPMVVAGQPGIELEFQRGKDRPISYPFPEASLRIYGARKLLAAQVTLEARDRHAFAVGSPYFEAALSNLEPPEAAVVDLLAPPPGMLAGGRIKSGRSSAAPPAPPPSAPRPAVPAPGPAAPPQIAGAQTASAQTASAQTASAETASAQTASAQTASAQGAGDVNVQAQGAAPFAAAPPAAAPAAVPPAAAPAAPPPAQAISPFAANGAIPPMPLAVTPPAESTASSSSLADNFPEAGFGPSRPPVAPMPAPPEDPISWNGAQAIDPGASDAPASSDASTPTTDAAPAGARMTGRLQPVGKQLPGLAPKAAPSVRPRPALTAETVVADLPKPEVRLKNLTARKGVKGAEQELPAASATNNAFE